jgi:hypothetical protein
MPEKGEKTIGQLFIELTQELRLLFRQEMELFTAEMKEKVTGAGKDAAVIGAGGILVATGLLVLVAAMVLGLATVLPAWVAAVVVGAAFIAAGAISVLVGRKALKHLEIKPEQTAESLKETAQWIKTLKPQKSVRRRTSFANRSGIRKAI